MLNPPFPIGIVTLIFVLNVPLMQISGILRNKFGVLGHHLIGGSLGAVVGGAALLMLPDELKNEVLSLISFE